MKKIGILLIILMILPMALFARGAQAGNENLRFAWWGNPLRNTQTTAVLNMFTAQSDVPTEEVVSTWGEYWGMMMTLAAAGNLPDVMQHDVGHLLPWVQSNLLLDLRPFIANGTIDISNIPPAVMEQGRIGEAIYGIPIGMNVAAMLYNRTLLDSLGLEAPRNMTMDQFINLSREIYRRSGVRTNLASSEPLNPLQTILRAQGVQPFVQGPGGRWQLGGSPANFQVFFDVIRQGIDEGWHFRVEDWGGRDRFAMATDPLVYPPGDANTNLRSWIGINWSNQIVGFQAAAPAGTTISMTTLPSANPAISNFGRASMFIAITRDARDRNAAAQLVNFWLNTQSAHDIMLAERGVIVNTQIANAVHPRLSPGAQLQSEFVNWVNQPANSAPFMPNQPEGATEFRAELILVTDMVMAGQLTPAAAAQRIFTFGNNTIR